MRSFRAGAAGTVLAALLVPATPTLAGDPEPDLELGRQVFLESGGDLPACAICHTLADAGATGAIGPNLDDLQPEEARVRRAVTEGVGVMPPFGEVLTEEQIGAVARYVAEAAGN